MKTILVVVILVLVLSGGLTFGVLQNKELAAETAVKTAVWWVLGVWPEVGNFKLDLPKHRIEVRDLKIRNPEGFPPEDKWMLQVPEISVGYDPASFAQRKLLLKEFTVIVKELTIVRDEKKRVNVETLKLIQQLKKNAAKRGETPSQTAGATIPFKIDRLLLKLDWVVYKDYTQGQWPFVQENRGVFNEMFQNVTDLNQVRKEIIARTIAGRAVNAFAKYQLGLFAPVSPALFSPQAKTGSETLEELVRTLLPFDAQKKGSK
jgi:hypothetical protein